MDGWTWVGAIRTQMTYWKALIIFQASHLRLIFQAGTLAEYHCAREKALGHSQPNRWFVPWGHEDTSSAWACSADLRFQCSAWAEIIMQATPWTPSRPIKVIRGAPPLHIQPYGGRVDRWVFNCLIVDPTKGFGITSIQPVSRIQYNSFTFSCTSFNFRPFHSSATGFNSLSKWFPPRTWLALAKGLSCVLSLWGEKGINTGLTVPPHWSSHALSCKVIFFAKNVFIGPAPISCGLGEITKVSSMAR